MDDTDGPMRTRPRVLVLASTYPRWVGDPEPGFVHELCRRLAARLDVLVLTPHAEGARALETMDGVLVRRYRYAPASFEVLVHGGGILTNLQRRPWTWVLVPSFLLSLGVALWRLARDWKPDVVHAHWLLPQGFVAGLVSSLPGPLHAPIVVTCHGSDLHGLKSEAMLRLKRFAAARASAMTVVGRPMVEKLEQLGVPGERIHVAPMGVDLANTFVPDPGVARTPGAMLFVGRLVEKKGLRHLVQAMPLVLRHCPHARLEIVGSGPEELALRAQVASLGLQEVVSFLGGIPNPDLPRLYRRASVLVAPFVEAGSGDQEGLGLVLVEAIGCGCPVVVGDVAAVADVLEPGDPGVVDPRDHHALALSIVEVLADPAAAARSASRRGQGIARFDWGNVAETYAGLLFARAAGRT